VKNVTGPIDIVQNVENFPLLLSYYEFLSKVLKRFKDNTNTKIN